MLHKKTKYALKALLALASSPEQTPMHIADLASAEAIPKKFLEAILLELKNHGILHSKKGQMEFGHICITFRGVFLAHKHDYSDQLRSKIEVREVAAGHTADQTPRAEDHMRTSVN